MHTAAAGSFDEFVRFCAILTLLAFVLGTAGALVIDQGHHFASLSSKVESELSDRDVITFKNYCSDGAFSRVKVFGLCQARS